MWARTFDFVKKNKKSTASILVATIFVLSIFWFFLILQRPGDVITEQPTATDPFREVASVEYLSQIDRDYIARNNYMEQDEKYQDLFALANNYYRANKYHEAVELLEKAIFETPDQLNYMTFELLGISYLRLGDNTKADENFNKAVELVNSSNELTDKELILKTIEQERKS